MDSILPKLHKLDLITQKFQIKRFKKNFKNLKLVLYHQSSLYVLEIIKIKLINKYHNNILEDYFDIKKTCKLITIKYYLLILCYYGKKYLQSYNFYLVFKTIRYKI